MKRARQPRRCDPVTVWCVLDAWLRCNVRYICQRHDRTIFHKLP